MNEQRDDAYEFEDDFVLTSVAPGTNILISGPSATPARSLAFRFVLAGNACEDGMILISIDKGGKQLLTQCENLCDNLDHRRFRAIGSQNTTPKQGTNTNWYKSVSTPGDLTGLGIKYSTLYEGLYQNERERIRTGISSLQTLLMYNDLRTVFRFLHVLTGRVTALGGVSVLYVDPTTLDNQTVSTIAQLFDGEITVREREKGNTEFRVRGLERQLTDWAPFDT